MSVISLPAIHNTSETEAAGRRDAIMEKKYIYIHLKSKIPLANLFGLMER